MTKMIYKIDLEHMIEIIDNYGFEYITQNETHVLVKSDQPLPSNVESLETYSDDQVGELWAADEWQQPTGE
jgi:hypothetical protein